MIKLLEILQVIKLENIKVLSKKDLKELQNVPYRDYKQTWKEIKEELLRKFWKKYRHADIDEDVIDEETNKIFKEKFGFEYKENIKELKILSGPTPKMINELYFELYDNLEINVVYLRKIRSEYGLRVMNRNMDDNLKHLPQNELNSFYKELFKLKSQFYDKT